MNTKTDGGQEQQQLQQALLGGQEQYLAEGKHCRLCYKTSSPETMIKPCACDGPLRYVHRQCLNELRAEHGVALRIDQTHSSLRGIHCVRVVVIVRDSVDATATPLIWSCRLAYAGATSS